MKLTTITHVSVDGVMQGLGGPDEDRRAGFERGGWALPLFGGEGAMFLEQVFGPSHQPLVRIDVATNGFIHRHRNLWERPIDEE
jgi:hypothetical protein